MTNHLSKDDFERGINEAMGMGITHIAPLGFSGDDVVMSGRKGDVKKGEPARISLVSFRMYCDLCEMLITDRAGHFIIYTKINGLDFSALVDEYYREYLLVESLIDTDINATFEKATFDLDKAELSKGFDLLGISNKEADDDDNA